MTDRIYRKAVQGDLDAIVEIYSRTHDAEEAGLTTIGWKRKIYPTRETAQAALERDDMYVCEIDGRVVATALINQLQVDVYEDAPWKFEAPNDKVLVIHTLCMEPTIKHQGIGREFIEYYENIARKMGCEVVRLDTNYANKVAQSFYKNLGYRHVDTVPTVFNGIEGVKLVLLEKKL